ncbi:hypothetical protein CALCODRAFT_493630 [Calocera cornea HHB12733]|uniref:PQ-loop-domain-containing protein n=1 Tax=Calocera cornea HHB12733 TaxID=1353952 RepID=A0A165HMR1_9BASI|nr:hypothetical protein CALCODRAFT_493630 [Calocera cornea HHB12733]
MPVNLVAENAFGTLGTICWCIQLVPQAWKSWREKSTHGLSPFLVLIWASCALPLGVYNITLNTNIPLIVQPQLFGTLGAFCWVQCLHYEKHLSPRNAALTFFAFLLVVGGLQVAFVFALRHGLAEGNDRPLQFFGVMTVILIFGGLLPQFYEIWKLKEVLGISMAFMVIDGLGGVFSTLSLAFKPSIDPLLAFSYISVIVLDGLVIVLQLVLNPIAAKARARRAAEAAPEITGSATPPDERDEKPPEPGLAAPHLHPPQPQSTQCRDIGHGIPSEILSVLPPRSMEEQEREAVEEERTPQAANTLTTAV